MMLLSTIVVASLSSLGDFIPVELAITEDQVVALFDDASSRLEPWLVVAGRSGEVAVVVPLGAASESDAAGPMPWGIVEEDICYTWHRGLRSLAMCDFNRAPIDKLIELRGGELDRAAQARIWKEIEREGDAMVVWPIQRILTSAANELDAEWNLFFDVETSMDGLSTVYRVRAGELFVSAHDENKQWDDGVTCATDIDGPFRVFTRGETRFLIDDEGVVYTADPGDHRPIGSIEGWPTMSDDRRTVFLTRDMTNGNTHVLEVTDDDVRQLEFDGRSGWDGGNPFSEHEHDGDTRDAVIRLRQAARDIE